MVAEIIPTWVQLTFSQLQNLIADVAIERDYKYSSGAMLMWRSWPQTQQPPSERRSLGETVPNLFLSMH